MIYRDFQDLHLSLLGFGTMRLPTTVDGAIDEDTTQAMVDYALAHGVNYFDTAWAYMQNLSETVVGRCLKKHPRDSFYLATKYPGHTLTCDPDPADTFAQQLEKCQVDYFDFYLLHNVYENDVDIYTDPRWGIIDYFVEQKRLGRIKHLGFSTHADLPCLTAFLERYGKEMEFCQIQLNYLDWTIQRAREKYELLEKNHIPVWVMEPVRGGKLARPGCPTASSSSTPFAPTPASHPSASAGSRDWITSTWSSPVCPTWRRWRITWPPLSALTPSPPLRRRSSLLRRIR